MSLLLRQRSRSPHSRDWFDPTAANPLAEFDQLSIAATSIVRDERNPRAPLVMFNDGLVKDKGVQLQTQIKRYRALMDFYRQKLESAELQLAAYRKSNH